MSKEQARRAALFAPSTTIFALCFVLPAAYFFVVSFWRVRSYKLTVDFTFDNYAAVFSDYGWTLVHTLLLAALIAGLVTALAFAFAYLCRFKVGAYAPFFLFATMLTLFGGYLTKIYIWRTILGTSGILNTSLMSVGLIDEPVTAFLFNPFAVVITLGHYLLPFGILPLYGSLQSIRDEPLEAARDLGASGVTVFRDIVLPQASVGLATAFTLTFLFAAGDFATARMIGGPDASLLGVFIQGQFTQRLNPPMGSAMAFTMVAASLAVVVAVTVGLKQALKYR